MKSNKGFRAADFRGETDDSTRKAVKLPPIKKSGKDKHYIYNNFGDEDEMEDLTQTFKSRESVYDYFDDLNDEEEIPEDEITDFLEDEWEDERDHGDQEEFPLDDDREEYI